MMQWHSFEIGPHLHGGVWAEGNEIVQGGSLEALEHATSMKVLLNFSWHSAIAWLTLQGFSVSGLKAFLIVTCCKTSTRTSTTRASANSSNHGSQIHKTIKYMTRCWGIRQHLDYTTLAHIILVVCSLRFMFTRFVAWKVLCNHLVDEVESSPQRGDQWWP